MTRASIRKRIAEIKRLALTDPETGHRLKEELLIDCVKFYAAGQVAQEVLKVTKVEFPW